MKKNFKKILSIVMILTMVFAMSATAFAGTTNDITVNIEFLYDGVDLGLGGTITIPGDYTRFYELPEDADDNSILVPANEVSVMDATLWYLDSIYCYDAVENELSWYLEPVADGQGNYIVKNWGGQIESMFATPNERLNSALDTEWWEGYAWIYSVNGVESDLFATNVEATNGMTITWDYKYVEKNLNEMA